MDILLELTDGFGTEGVRNNLALAGVLCPVAGVEETSPDGDEGIVKFTIPLVRNPPTEDRLEVRSHLRLEEPISMAVDELDSVWVRDGDMVGLNANHFAVFLVCLVHEPVPLSSSGGVHEP